MRTLAFHPDGVQLASASADGVIKIWDMRAQQLTQHYYAHTGPVSEVAFHPSGRWLLSASLDGTLRLYDAAAGQLLYTLDGQSGPVHTAAFSPKGNFIASGGHDRQVRIWSAQIREVWSMQQCAESHQSNASIAGSFEERPLRSSQASDLPVSGDVHATFSAAKSSAAAQHTSPALVTLHSSSLHPPSFLAGQRPRTLHHQNLCASSASTVAKVTASGYTSNDLLHLVQLTEQLQELDQRMEMLNYKVHFSEALIKRAAGHALPQMTS